MRINFLRGRFARAIVQGDQVIRGKPHATGVRPYDPTGVRLAGQPIEVSLFNCDQIIPYNPYFTADILPGQTASFTGRAQLLPHRHMFGRSTHIDSMII